MTGFDSQRVTRRRVLGATGAGVAVTTAGCLSGNGGDETDDSNSTDEHQYAIDFDHPGDEPVEFTDDQSCPVCGMTPTGYPDWQCQLAHEDGSGATFDTPGCLFAYYAVPPTDSDVVAAWVTDFRTRELVDATEASFVIVTDSDAVPDEVMDLNPRPFADSDDAVDYLGEWDAEELTEDDIIELEDVDREIAEIYRGNRMPDE
ncbi:nitrous oxide reductase accessory protein NosL [Natrialbaceae archaeon A-arb3/5]